MKTLLILVLMILIGCGPSEAERAYDKKMVERKDKVIQSCFDAGGVPVLSTWDGRLADCIFPPGRKP